MVWFSTHTALEARTDADDAGRVVALVALSTRIGDFVHEAQRERGLTNGFLISKGERFTPS